jgi:hypothetical protein
MGKPGLRSGRNLFLRLGGRLPRPGWRLRLRGPGRWSIGLRDRGRGAGAKHDIKHAAPYLVALGGRRRWWWCAWLGHGASLVWYPSIAWSLSAARNRRLAEQHAAPASRRCCRPLAASTQEGGPAKVTRDNEPILASYAAASDPHGNLPPLYQNLTLPKGGNFHKRNVYTIRISSYLKRIAYAVERPRLLAVHWRAAAHFLYSKKSSSTFLM